MLVRTVKTLKNRIGLKMNTHAHTIEQIFCNSVHFRFDPSLFALYLDPFRLCHLHDAKAAFDTPYV